MRDAVLDRKGFFNKTAKISRVIPDFSLFTIAVHFIIHTMFSALPAQR